MGPSIASLHSIRMPSVLRRRILFSQQQFYEKIGLCLKKPCQPLFLNGCHTITLSPEVLASLCVLCGILLRALRLKAFVLQLHSYRALYRSIPRHYPSTFAEPVHFTPPIKVTAGETSRPNKESQKIAQRIKPAKIKRARIADDSPSHRNRLHHSIQESRHKQAQYQSDVP